MTKETSKERVRKWREDLRRRGGRELKVTLEPKTAKFFDGLKRIYKRKTNNEIIALAIDCLARETRKPAKKKESE